MLVEELGFDCRLYYGHSHRSRQASNVFAVFFVFFESGGISKHLMTDPSGNSEFCFLETLNDPPSNIEGLRETNSLFPLEASR